MIDEKNKIIISENVMLREHPEIVKDNYTIKDTNLSENINNTKKFKDCTGLKIINCNIRNCVFPKDTEIIDCKQKDYHKDFKFPTKDEVVETWQ